MDSTLQSRLHLWRRKNFGENETVKESLVNQVLGVAEEAGELAHAHLKLRQGIRGSEQGMLEAEKDAVGDILIFLAGFCSYRGWNMQAIFEDTAAHVMERDWVKYPKTGYPA